jgi:dihydropteroate synthase
MYSKTLNCKGTLLSLEKPIVMGILNATPDSFYNKGRNNALDELLSVANNMILEGATILDIGGMSSRPGADEVSEDAELQRVIPIIDAISTTFPNVILSIDTYRSKVAKDAISHGVQIINDISGGDADASIIELAATNNTPYICMHKKGIPKTMQENPSYENVLEEVMNYFTDKIALFKKHHLHDIILDVGFGFGKNLMHNYELLSQMNLFSIFEKPIIAGISRKSMICKPLHCSPENALNGTTALHMIALQQGASILRVHDVKEAMECITLFELAKSNTKSTF